MQYLELTRAKTKEYFCLLPPENKIIGTLELKVQKEVITK